MGDTAENNHSSVGDEQRIFSIESLRVYNGDNESLPIYIALKGSVFDVTLARNFYGPDGPYSVFAGRDASRGLAAGDLMPKNIVENLSYDTLHDLTAEQLESLDGWVKLYKSKYKIVGRLSQNKKDKESKSKKQEEKNPVGVPAPINIKVAIKRGSLEYVKKYYDKESMTEVDSKGYALTHTVVKMGNLDILKYLIEEKNVDTSVVNPATKEGWVHIACQNRHSHILEYLITENKLKDINQRDRNGLSPFLIACSQGHEECIQILYKNKADIFIRDEQGWNGLMWAAGKGHIHLFETLLGLGFRLQDTDNEGNTVLHLGGYSCSSATFEKLKELGFNPNIINKKGKKPILRNSQVADCAIM